MSKIHHRVSRIITIFLGILSQQIFAQDGSLFLTHYFPQNEAYTANLNMIYEPNGHVMLANERGILIFDGYQWELISTPDIPTVLFTLPGQEKVMVGGRNMLGWLNEKTRASTYIILCGTIR